jgi:hypothetical protein
LPDGLFSNQTAQFGKKFRASYWKMFIFILWLFGIFYGHLGYFMTIWYILCSFGTFFRFGYRVPRKNVATMFYLSFWMAVVGGIRMNFFIPLRVPSYSHFTFFP